MADSEVQSTRLEELFELTRVRVLQFTREPEVLFWVFGFPVVLAAVLGFAFRKSEIEPSRIGVVAPASAAVLLEALERAEHVEVVELATREEADRALRKTKIDAWIAPSSAGHEAPLVRLDPSRPEAEIARLRLERALDPSVEESTQFDVDAMQERGSRYVDFLYPGLLGMNIMGTGMWLIGFAIADLRQKKVLRRLLVTPMRRSSFLASFLLSRLAFFSAEVGVLVLFGVFVLDVPFRCNVLSFAFLCTLGAMTFSGLGMLITSRVKTIQGASGMLNLALVPMWLFTGVFFSYGRFPEVLHPWLELLPLTGLNDALRGMMLEGDGLADVGGALAIQVVWAVLSFGIALKIFRWE